jgi:hypothetical protein
MSPECQFGVAMSFLPSPSRSAIATENGVRLSDSVVPAVKVPLPLPSRIVSVVGVDPLG